MLECPTPLDTRSYPTHTVHLYEEVQNEGHINLGRAATLLDLSSYKLDERFRRLGVPRRVGPQTEKEARAEVEAALDLVKG